MEFRYKRTVTITYTNNYESQQLKNMFENIDRNNFQSLTSSDNNQQLVSSLSNSYNNYNNENQQLVSSLSDYSNNKNHSHKNRHKNNNNSPKNSHKNKRKESNHKKKSSIYYNLFDIKKVLIQNQSICDSICIYKNLYNTNENVIHRMFDEYKEKSIYFKNEKQVWNSLKSTMNKFSQGINSSSIEQEFYQKLNH